MSARREALTDGEIWTREQLELLLEQRFTPAATARFLIASSARAAEIREQRPELARRGRLWLAVGAAAWTIPAAAGMQPFRRRALTGLTWWGATGAMLNWHLGMFETEGGSPRQLGAADAFTLARAWLVPVVADSPTVPVLMLGTTTDLLDGALARRGEPTRAGRDLEGLVDTCFSLAALRGLTRAGRLSGLSAAAEAGRLATGTSFAVLTYFGRGRPPDAKLTRAARSASMLRLAGVLAAASGRRRGGDALVVAGALASTVLAARALTRDK